MQATTMARRVRMTRTLLLQERENRRKAQAKGLTPREKIRRKKDMSKIKCFDCHQQGHYVSQCPNRKKGEKKKQQATTSTNIAELSSRFEEEFSLIACLSSSITTCVWYIDIGVSCHMTRIREYFSS